MKTRTGWLDFSCPFLSPAGGQSISISCDKAGIPVQKLLKMDGDLLKMRSGFFGASNRGEFVSETEYTLWFRDAERGAVYEGETFTEFHSDDVLPYATAVDLTGIPFKPYLRLNGRKAPNYWLGSEDRYFVTQAALQSVLKPGGKVSKELVHVNHKVRANGQNREFARFVNEAIAEKRGERM